RVRAAKNLVGNATGRSHQLGLVDHVAIGSKAGRNAAKAEGRSCGCKDKGLTAIEFHVWLLNICDRDTTHAPRVGKWAKTSLGGEVSPFLVCRPAGERQAQGPQRFPQVAILDLFDRGADLRDLALARLIRLLHLFA